MRAKLCYLSVYLIAQRTAFPTSHTMNALALTNLRLLALQLKSFANYLY